MSASLPFLTKPGAHLLHAQEDQIVYRCFCGHEARTNRETWDQGIHHCDCTGKHVPYPVEDLTGQRFHRLTVTAWAGKPHWSGTYPGRSGPQHWHVACVCGQTFCLPVASVKYGKPWSCLCHAKTPPEPRQSTSPRHIAANLSGKEFGRLTALHRAPRGERKTHSVIWLCQCSCGNTKEVAADNLTLGRVQSCGCLRRGPKARGQREPATTAEIQVSEKP